MDVRFWGVRGSIAVSGETYAKTGGNTTCVSLHAQGQTLILDGGSGLAQLGKQLASPLNTTILFSHVHWDHIQGVPFFAPAYDPRSTLTFAGAPGLSAALHQQMQPPTFPVTMEAFHAQLRFQDIRPNEPFETGPFHITPLATNHPDGTLAFRITADGQTVVFATDVEHGAQLDADLLRLSQGANLLIHDAQYTAAEYCGEVGPSRRGWGHSTIGQAVEVAISAQVEQLALTHHDPTRDDIAIDALEALAGQRFNGAFMAREGQLVQL